MISSARCPRVTVWAERLERSLFSLPPPPLPTPTLSVSLQTATHTWAPSCILGMSFLIFLLLFFPAAPPLALQLSPALCLRKPLLLTPCHVRCPSSSTAPLMKAEVQQEVHLHLYHTCNVLSSLMAGAEQHGINTTLWEWHACHLESSSQGSFHMKHECSRGDFNATCPGYHRSPSLPFSSPHHKARLTLWKSSLCLCFICD